MDKENLTFGIGINDRQVKVKENNKDLKFYAVWRDMLRRCYDVKYLEKKPTYRGCAVGEEWKYISSFKKWFDEHYVEGWQLDKDLLVKGNKIYSPNTCVFLPREINSFLAINQSNKGSLPVGICFHKRDRVYEAHISFKNEQIYLGRSHDVEKLSLLYKKEKEREAKELAEEYKDKLDPRAYRALIDFKID